jgi:hypothetical protein
MLYKLRINLIIEISITGHYTVLHKTISIPFTPSVGMEIWVSGGSLDHFKLENLLWKQQEQMFYTDVRSRFKGKEYIDSYKVLGYVES